MADYPRPSNGWGQAAANNDNGFGQGAGNSTNGWGYIHALTPPNPATDFVGAANELTEGWTLYLESNDTEPLNTANQIDATTSTVLTFNDLTGIDIDSTVGTGTFSKSGDTIICTSNGSLQYLKLDNGVVFLLTAARDVIFSSDGSMSATLTNHSWSLAVDTPIINGTQTALNSYNQDYWFNRVDTAFEIANGTAQSLIGKRVITQFTYFTIPQRSAVYYAMRVSIARFIVGTRPGLIGVTAVGSGGTNNFFISADDENINDGDLVTVIAEVTDYNNVVVTINGITPTDSITNLPSLNNGEYIGVDTTTNGRYHKGFVPKVRIEDLTTGELVNEYTSQNNYGGATQLGVISKSVIPEDESNLGTDIFGIETTENKLTNGYNLSENNHFISTQILDRTGSGTDGFLIIAKTDEVNEVYAKDDVIEIGNNATGYLYVTFNGVTLTSTHLVIKSIPYFIKFTQNGSGLGTIYVGTDVNYPADFGSGAVGLPVAATTAMVYGQGLEGYLTQPQYHPFEETIDEIRNDYLVSWRNFEGVPESTLSANNLVVNDLSVWATGCWHSPKDIENISEYPFQQAYTQVTGTVDYDVVLAAGDYDSKQSFPTGSDPDIEDLHDEIDVMADNSLLYPIAGNHDGGDGNMDWYKAAVWDYVNHSSAPFRKLGQRVGQEWENYYFKVGNVLVIMLSDRNDLPYPVGRGGSVVSGGHPSGAMTQLTFNWMKHLIVSHPDYNIITVHHELPKDTTIATGSNERIDEDTVTIYHGSSGIAEGSGALWSIYDTETEISDDAQTQMTDLFVDYPIVAHLGAHTHTDINHSSHGRTDKEMVNGVQFVNVGHLGKEHNPTGHIHSTFLNFTDASTDLVIKPYKHDATDYPQGFYAPGEITISLKHPYNPNY